MSSPILIAGGGIGGLSAAIALRRAGLPAEVLERAPEIGEVGAGLAIQANAILALRRLGLDRAVIAAGRGIQAASIRRWDGRALTRSDFREIEALLGAPFVAIHRATLQRVLLEALGTGIVRTGCEVVGYEAGPDGVGVRLGAGPRMAGSGLVRRGGRPRGGGAGVEGGGRCPCALPRAPRGRGRAALRGIRELAWRHARG